MIFIEIFTPGNVHDLLTHRWFKYQCFNQKCAKLLRDTNQQTTASEKIMRPYGVIEGRTFCLPCLFQEIATLTGQQRKSILDISEKRVRRNSILDEDP